MKSREEKNWELMQQVLMAESNGNAPVRLSSQRTLFGIPSHVEEVIERTAAEMDADAIAQRRAKRATQTAGDDHESASS